MKLILNKDGNYICEVCKFIFGPITIANLGNKFNEYHTNLHSIVIKNKKKED